MNSRLWKILVVVLALSIMFTFNVMENAHSKNINISVYVAPHVTYNGSAIAILAEEGYSVNGIVEITPSFNIPGAAPKVIFPNGTEMTIHLTTHLRFHFSMQMFAGNYVDYAGNSTPFPGNVPYSGFGTLSISPSQPLAVIAYRNFSLSDFSSPAFSGGQGYLSGFHGYFLYVIGDASVQVRMVGVAL